MADLLPQPYHVYLDLDVVNNDVESGAQPHPLVFEEVRNTPFLDGDCSNYFCSIVRFSIQAGSSLPVFIPRMDTAALASGDLYKTAYKISLNYRSRVITQNVIFNNCLQYLSSKRTFEPCTTFLDFLQRRAFLPRVQLSRFRRHDQYDFEQFVDSPCGFLRFVCPWGIERLYLPAHGV